MTYTRPKRRKKRRLVKLVGSVQPRKVGSSPIQAGGPNPSYGGIHAGAPNPYRNSTTTASWRKGRTKS